MNLNYYLTFIILIYGHALFAQKNSKSIIQPIIFENKKIYELSLENKVIENVNYDGNFIHAKILVNNDTLEYYRMNDSMIFHRNFSNGRIINKGAYKLENRPVETHTVTTFNPETYEEESIVIASFNLYKDGEWTEAQNDSLYLMGSYLNKKKSGRWFISKNNINFTKHLEYIEGEIHTLYNPSYNYSNAYLNWLTQDSFVLCSIAYVQSSENKKIEQWGLEKDPPKNCYFFATITFQKNGTFEYTHNPDYEMEMSNLNGLGTWKLNTNGVLELKFKNQINIKFGIDKLSARKITLIEK